MHSSHQRAGCGLAAGSCLGFGLVLGWLLVGTFHVWLALACAFSSPYFWAAHVGLLGLLWCRREGRGAQGDHAQPIAAWNRVCALSPNVIGVMGRTVNIAMQGNVAQPTCSVFSITSSSVPPIDTVNTRQKPNFAPSRNLQFLDARMQVRSGPQFSAALLSDTSHTLMNGHGPTDRQPPKP